ncbi:HalOD1 output domain-containing protein [Halorubrum sp. CBA1125]|uniref:HalOD1 output domain-containing protein n=1 Tax=Halorubrum sp. CBA1125 TaxID=2668072 RepID=UPI0037432B2D
MIELKDPITHTIDAVAEAENAEAVEREPPLAEVIDPDALETLVEDSTASELEDTLS